MPCKNEILAYMKFEKCEVPEAAEHFGIDPFDVWGIINGSGC